MNHLRKKIAVIAGGDSSEIVVSLKSAAGIMEFIDSSKYEAILVLLEKQNWRAQYDNQEIEINKNNFSFSHKGQEINFDCAYITIHGTPGENGLIQGYFDLIKMPYTSCGVLSSALTFDKFVCNHYLQVYGIKAANSLLVRKGNSITNDEVINTIKLPCFIKPNQGGSSFGVSKVKNPEEIQQAINKAFIESNEVIIESYLSGIEITCGLYKSGNEIIVFPITEVVSSNDFFDFEAKYTANKAEEITPARISENTTKRVQNISKHIYEILNCKGIIRIDYIIDEQNGINLLEVNTTPGMTPTSFIPQQIRAAGMSIMDTFSNIISETLQGN